MLALALSMNVALGFSQSAGGAAPAEFTRVPGGIVDATGTVVYVTQLRFCDFGIVAVDVKSGELLWDRARMAKPLALVGDQLLVLAPERGKPGVLRVHFLNVQAKGERVRESEPLTFPTAPWVGDGRDQAVRGASFATHVEVSGDDLYIHWKSNTFWSGGVRPPPEAIKGASSSVIGIAKVDVRSGAVVMLAGDRSVWREEEPFRAAELPEPVQAVARRENWNLAEVVGQRAYGRATEQLPGGGHRDHVHVVDVATGRCLWRRGISEFNLPLPP